MYERSFWNDRYAEEGYLYGTEPNTFLVEHADRLEGPVLSLSEGEGRNAVFLATRGLKVLGVDSSAVGLDKAQALAKAQGVEIDTLVADLGEFVPQHAQYGSVISISAHLPSAVRKKIYPLVVQSLRPNGLLLLEAYTERQLHNSTGGPKDLDMLMNLEKLREEFPQLTPIFAREVDREVHEGSGHSGLASVVQFIARKQE